MARVASRSVTGGSFYELVFSDLAGTTSSEYQVSHMAREASRSMGVTGGVTGGVLRFSR